MTTEEIQSPAESDADVGLATLASVHRRLMIDEEWTEWGDRQFAWTAYRLGQIVTATPMSMSRDIPVSWIGVRTTVVTKVCATREQVEKWLGLRNYLCVGSAYVFGQDEGVIDLVCGHTIHAETLEYRSEQLADFAILQLCEAERDAEALASVTNGQVAEYIHSARGLRIAPDEMLAILEEHFAPRGRASSLFRSADEFEKVYEYFRGTPMASLGGDENGICLEVPFGANDTSLIELRSDVTHPWLGSGLAVATTFRTGEKEERLYAIAARLQQLQLMTLNGGGQFGAWSVRSLGNVPHLAYSRFVPNALFRPQMALDVTIGEVNRASWVDQLLHPDLPQRNAGEAMRARYEPPEYPH